MGWLEYLLISSKRNSCSVIASLCVDHIAEQDKPNPDKSKCLEIEYDWRWTDFLANSFANSHFESFLF